MNTNVSTAKTMSHASIVMAESHLLWLGAQGGYHGLSSRNLDCCYRWDEKAGLRRDAVRSQVINVLEAQAIKETGNEEG
jgi:hypothetical protein